MISICLALFRISISLALTKSCAKLVPKKYMAAKAHRE
jgi:hypothetical protein